MKANELRIGNWVKTCVPDMEVMIPYLDTQVQGIDIFGRPIFCHTPQREGFSMSPNHITGIPLTPEILEKAGFEKAGANDHYGGYLSPQDEFMQRIRVRTTGGTYFYTSNDAAYPLFITSLHQLQNLYFALTATELEINLNKEK